MMKILMFILVGFLYVFCASSSTSDTVKVRQILKGDTATATIKSVTLTAAPIATSYSADSVLVIQNGVIKKRYSPPVILSFTNNTGTMYAGQTVTGLTTAWTLGGAPITSQTHTDCTPALGDRSHVFTGLSLTNDKYYTLAITDGKTPSSANTWVYFMISKYYGTSVNSAPTESNIKAGTNSWQYQNVSYRALAATEITGEGKYIYYAYPASWGSVQIWVNGLQNNWSKTTVSVTNAYGNTQNYYVYTSPSTIIGTLTVSAIGN